MLYTRKGDSGTSGLFGTSERFPKHSPIYDALGSVDELNSLLGLCRARAQSMRKEALVRGALLQVQEQLFIIQAELAGADKSTVQSHVDALEAATADFESQIENPHQFVIPGATEFSALCDVARAVARRAERAVTAVSPDGAASAPTLAYLNRLSSFLYALARFAAMSEGVREQSPGY